MLLLVALLTPALPAHATTVDLAIEANNITFSESVLYAGDTVRIYAKVRNVGEIDATAYVLFYQGAMVIGQSQAVSLRVGGNPDDVFVDFTLPRGTFNIRAVIQGSSPQDLNPENDTALTPLYSTISDEDRDGVIDDDDNCVDDANADQADADGDGKGDVCDSDDDNDGVSDADDAFPTDPTKTSDEIVVPPVETPPTTIVSTSSATSVATTTPSPTPASEAITSVASAVATLTSSTSKLTISPLAHFSSRQIDWRTYEFRLAEQPTDGMQFSWDFGDGATSVQSQIVHAFSGPGTYTVTLATTDKEGNKVSDAQVYDVSFFHLDNPKVIGLIIVLFVAMGLFTFAFITLRKKYDQGVVHK